MLNQSRCYILFPSRSSASIFHLMPLFGSIIGYRPLQLPTFSPNQWQHSKFLLSPTHHQSTLPYHLLIRYAIEFISYLFHTLGHNSARYTILEVYPSFLWDSMIYPLSKKERDQTEILSTRASPAYHTPHSPIFSQSNQ
jgi:hypothetical protein